MDEPDTETNQTTLNNISTNTLFWDTLNHNEVKAPENNIYTLRNEAKFTNIKRRSH